MIKGLFSAFGLKRVFKTEHAEGLYEGSNGKTKEIIRQLPTNNY